MGFPWDCHVIMKKASGKGIKRKLFSYIQPLLEKWRTLKAIRNLVARERGIFSLI